MYDCGSSHFRRDAINRVSTAIPINRVSAWYLCPMKIMIAFLFSFVFWSSDLVLAQAPYLKDSLGIVGACHADRIYDVSFKLLKNKPAKCLVNDEEILKRINALAWLRQHELKKAKGSIMLIINCEGDLINVRWIKEGVHEELNYYIFELFKKHNKWEPALLNNKPVDSYVIRKLRIKNGVVSWG
jgi:hypothetical protein